MAIKAKRQGIDVYPGVAEALPFPDGRFDFALMVTTICFVDDVIKGVKNRRQLEHCLEVVSKPPLDPKPGVGLQI